MAQACNECIHICLLMYLLLFIDLLFCVYKYIYRRFFGLARLHLGLTTCFATTSLERKQPIKKRVGMGLATAACGSFLIKGLLKPSEAAALVCSMGHRSFQSECPIIVTMHVRPHSCASVQLTGVMFIACMHVCV